MKRIFALTIALLMLVLLAACAGNGTKTSKTVALALVTGVGSIDDKDINQDAWEGLQKYAQEHDATPRHYQSSGQDNDACLSAIEIAVKDGAKVIVLPGSLFEVPAYVAQERYPNVYFILVDGVPHNSDNSDSRIDSNMVCVTYAEEQAGFLAGYAAVKEGNINLGFLGSEAAPPVVRYGHGYVQGADYAAREMGYGQGSILINYQYTGDTGSDHEIRAIVDSWYNDDYVETIFVCGGAMSTTVLSAAEEASGKVIGADVDRSAESSAVITSAVKNIKASVYNCVYDYFAANTLGGQHYTSNAENEGIGLSMENSKFVVFTRDEYDAIYDKLRADEITVNNDVEISVTQLSTLAVAVKEY